MRVHFVRDERAWKGRRCTARILNTRIFYVRATRARNPVIKVVNKRFRRSHVRLRSEREIIR